MAKGQINVQTENIFPIIKKFLYSDQEIFLRELVSNAVDATQKLKTLSNIGEVKGDIGETQMEIIIDEKAKTLTFSDRGIGMTGEEVEKYINQIAFSGAEEFVEKYKDKASVIGHFGLGFYSSFMVADKVEIFSKSYLEGSKAVKWECDGSPNFSLEENDTRKERGTDIVLHISEDAKDYLKEHKIKELLNKYCKFMAVPIKFGTKEINDPEFTPKKTKDKDGKETTEPHRKIKVDNIINNPTPAWTKAPADLSDDDYKNFYRELYPMNFEESLFHIHLNVDYPFNLTGILYFPKLKRNLEVQKDKIQLYSNQVFVTDSVEGIVPDFLTLLHGVIDSPDIPLNVSRSYLQSDGNVKKISNYISKKVADKLHELFKEDRKAFEAKWDDIKIFIEYGILSDEKFAEKAKKFTLYKNTKGEYFTMDEYKTKIEVNQTDKDSKVVFLYSSNVDTQYSYIAAANDKGYDVLVMDTPLSSHLVGKLEQMDNNHTFTRVDGDTIDQLIKKDEEIPSKLTEDDEKTLKPIIESAIPNETFTVNFVSLSEKDQPMTITQAEFMRRMKDMSALGGGGMMGMGNMPDMYNLAVNSNHPLISRILTEKDEAKQKDMAKQATDLALLSQNLLKGEELSKFIKRSVELI
ncbi:MAG: molecular chaperone HtpG [Bacteroidetes bacterium]|nr:MAG: molecular chaperone HtpG [Bacteroidota bacterium]MBL1144940.1 molecular chaperone HtpG [Bacteroidota bacterium]MCB0803643.1 molecular chaperone HtpG [Flavobacteriales bacterium]NOG57734.1 molecular chaperone HtpG [Bacteroidota bacterium]